MTERSAQNDFSSFNREGTAAATGSSPCRVVTTVANKLHLLDKDADGFAFDFDCNRISLTSLSFFGRFGFLASSAAQNSYNGNI